MCSFICFFFKSKGLISTRSAGLVGACVLDKCSAAFSSMGGDAGSDFCEFYGIVASKMDAFHKNI